MSARNQTILSQPCGQPKQKSCSNCGVNFTCGPVAGKANCWCEELPHVSLVAGADLIVMRAGRSRVATLLGSTAEQVSRTASCPVLVIHMDEDTETKSHRAAEFSRVLVSHDFSSSSELALSYALSIAQKFRAELHLLHVLPEPEENELQIAWNEGSVESAYQRAIRRLRSAVPEDIHKWCSVTHVVRWGKPYREVLAYASEQGVDLLCMGAFGRDFGLQALFGSNVDRVLRQASCPTLVARPFQAALPALFGSRVVRSSLKSGLSMALVLLVRELFEASTSWC